LTFTPRAVCLVFIAIAKVDGTLIKWMNRIKKAKLLILDDFGLQQMSHDVKLTLLQILEDRYKEAATDQNLAITTEKLARLY